MPNLNDVTLRGCGANVLKQENRSSGAISFLPKFS
jgi:hypothetical protein